MASRASAAKPARPVIHSDVGTKNEAHSKQDRIIALLRSPAGTTIAAMMQETGWQHHSVRGFLAGVVRKKLKFKLESNKVDGNRVYRIEGEGPPKASRPMEEPNDDGGIVKGHVVRVEVQAGQLVVQLASTQKSKRGRHSAGNPLHIPWHKSSSVRRREILLPDNGSSQIPNARPIRSETRATLVASIARGRDWLDEIIEDPNATSESIAKRERCSPRKINKTISLAFLSPELVKAAIAGKLPHGMGVARLFDLPAEWSRQRQVLGLAA